MSLEVRAGVAEVWRRTVEWRNRPEWTDTEHNRQRYEITRDVARHVAQLPDPTCSTDRAAMVAAVDPLIRAWWPNRAGPEQAIHAAAERVRDATQRLAG